MSRGALVSTRHALLAALLLVASTCALFLPQTAIARTVSPARAEKPISTFYREVWTTRQGLPHNQVNTMAQTPEGYLWLGTWEGIVRYDGLEFQIFDRGNTPELKDNGIRSLQAAADGALVAGTARGGVVIKRGNRWQTLEMRDGLAENSVMDALIDRRGRLWVAHESHGVTRVENGRFTHLNVANGGLPSDVVYSLAEDGDGDIWVASARGLVHLTDRGSRVLGSGAGLPDGAIVHLTQTRSGQLLIGTERGAYRRIGHEERFEPISPLLPKDNVPSLAEDAAGNLWVGTINNGLYRMSALGLEHFTSDDELPNNRTASLLVDREGSLWAGTNAGLLHLADTPFTNWGRAQGMSDDYVRALSPADQGGVWIGTGRGLNLWRDNRVVASYTHADGLPGDSILSLQPSRDDSLLVGTYNNGLLRLRDGKVVAHYDTASGMPGSDQVRAIAEQADGTLWIGTTRGLVRYRDGQYRLITRADGLPREFVLALHIDRKGALWVGTSDGVAVIRGDRIETIDVRAVNDGKVEFDFLDDPDGTVWIASDRGLIRWRNGQMHSLGLAQGLPFDTFFAVVDDGRGAFWLTSNRGVLRVARASVDAVLDGRSSRLQVDHFSEPDGLASAQCNGGSSPAAILDARGNVWVATAGGAAMVAPTALQGNRPALPQVVLEQILADDRVVDWVEGQPLQLPAGTRKLEFRYAAISFLIPRFLRYRHRLNGVDSGWVETSNRRMAQFTNLGPGQYEFDVAVSAPSLGQAWSPRSTRVQIDIAPQLWQRTGFHVALVVAFGLLLVGLIRWRTHSLRQHAALLEHVVEQRTHALSENAAELRRADKEKSVLLDRLREQTRDFQRMALEDSLTHVSNRRNLDAILAATFAGAVAADKPLSFALFDVDLFKQINDNYSHDSGDRALIAIAHTLRDGVGERGTVARWGGEEFAVLLPDTDLKSALKLCEELRIAVEAIDCSAYAPGTRLTVSAGVVDRTGISHHEKMVSHADKLLYWAKSAGRNRVCG
ncbi:ligand-binding sensor domain-containing diguanylate cyclase [Thermomonas sp.]|uniref:ligand-binding sensor domain-containing diguanylate cyclase n=1 Tax=Thermomonas sp. TaxID=1971895 RepID=UPI002636E465|nr:ligand-binding sensor domain-containing diguanylate cyclase [Thermomonas sp.]